MTDDNVIIQGACKYRDGKKWKSRWCVIKKLSPVAEWGQLEVRRSSGGGVTAAVALEGLVGAVAGVTLDRHSHTLALVARDLVSLLAFDTREQLLHWQVRIRSVLGEGVWFEVEVESAGGQRGQCGVRAGRAALIGGNPPAVLRYWDLHTLRRFGVVSGRVVVEEGGRGGEVHVLRSPRLQRLHTALLLAAAHTSPVFNRKYREYESESPRSNRVFRSESRLSELTSLDLPLLRKDTERGETEDWNGREPPVGISRCRSCVSKLSSVTSMNSMTPVTPSVQFSPAWTLHEELPVDVSNYVRPLHQTRPPSTNSRRADTVTRSQSFCSCHPVQRHVGPYENYDVPKSISVAEYYDTPKQFNDNIGKDVFSISKSTAPDSMIVKKPCGCLLKLGRKKRPLPTVVDDDDHFAPGSCPCTRVTDWANNFIGLPYCSKYKNRSTNDIANSTDRSGDADVSALYATVDVTRKIRRQALKELSHNGAVRGAHYENLEFARSLQHYENSRALLRGCSGYLYMRPAPPAPRDPSSTSGDSGVCSPPPPPRPRSADPFTHTHAPLSHKSSSAEAEVPVLKTSTGACSSSSGTSDLSDYIETLSLCSSHSSTDPPPLHHVSSLTHARVHRSAMSTLRPRSGNEYKNVDTTELIQQLSDDVMSRSDVTNDTYYSRGGVDHVTTVSLVTSNNIK